MTDMETTQRGTVKKVVVQGRELQITVEQLTERREGREQRQCRRDPWDNVRVYADGCGCRPVPR